MQIIHEGLKNPLHYCTQQILGHALILDPVEPSFLGNVARKVHNYALAAFFSVAAMVATVPWVVGDTIEWLHMGNKPFEDPVQPFNTEDQQSLDPNITEFLGASMSTYQNTADEDFCVDSDWGNYNKKNFIGEKSYLAPGGGVDILTKKGRKMLLDAIERCNGNTIRFSVEWADILKSDGSFKDIAMQKYVEAAKECADRRITPIITLHHFVSPLDADGQMIFENRKGIDEFVEYAVYVHENLKEYTTHFVTFNEPHVNGVMNYILGDFPAGNIANFWKHTQVTSNMLEAHNNVHKRLHEINPDVQVGITHQALRFMPSSRWNYLARIAAFVFTYAFHESFMQWAEKSKTIDWLGVQYYTTPLLGGLIPDSTCRNDEKMVEAMRFRFLPQGLLPILEELGTRLGNKVPLVVTETGTAGTNSIDKANQMDTKRAKYMKQAMEAISIAQKKHNVTGVLFWSLFGNFEWDHGNNKKQDFGMIARDGDHYRDTQGFEVIAKVFKNTVKKEREVAV